MVGWEVWLCRGVGCRDYGIVVGDARDGFKGRESVGVRDKINVTAVEEMVEVGVDEPFVAGEEG